MTDGSSSVFRMPALGADMTEGRIDEWLVAPGDVVVRGQIVAVVETDKSDIEVEVFHDGVVEELLAAPGTVVPVGEPIARLAPVGAGEPIAAEVVGVDRAALPTEHLLEPVPSLSPVDEAVVRSGSSAGATLASTEAPPRVTSPLVRHLADDLHVDLERVHPTGRGGLVHRDDVVRAARPRVTPRARRLAAQHGLDLESLLAGVEVLTGDHVDAALATRAAPPATGGPPPVPTVPSGLARAGAADAVSTMRARIAATMQRSWTTIPHFHVRSRLDLGAALDALADLNDPRPPAERILPAALLLRATARAAAATPALNGWWIDDGFRSASTVDLGMVVSLRTGGLVVPVIRDADQLDLETTMTALTDVVDRARRGRLRSGDVGDASLTVTLLGERGADEVSGVIQPPQVALVGFGAVHVEPWADEVGGPVTARPTVVATIAADHRAVDGRTASQLLARIARELENPDVH